MKEGIIPMEPMPFRRPAAEPPSLASLTRAIIARAAAALDGGGAARATDYAASNWPNDQGVPLVLRAAVSPTTTSATALMPVVQQFAAALQPLSAAGELMARGGISLSSFGRGLVAVPSFAPGESDFVAEAAPIPVKQFVSSGPTLSPYKLATICVVSGEMIEHTDAEAMVRAALAESVALALDRAIFSATAASAARPAGILNGIAALTPTAGGGAAQDVMASDLGKLLVAIAPVAASGYLIVAAEPQAIGLQFRLGQRLPNIFASGALAAGTIIAIAPQAFVSVLETPRIDASIEAIVHMDSAPAAIANGGGVAAPARSLFQTNSVGLRMITPVSWGLRAASAVAWMSAVNW
jgi:hypothetical protein